MRPVNFKGGEVNIRLRNAGCNCWVIEKIIIPAEILASNSPPWYKNKFVPVKKIHVHARYMSADVKITG